MWFLPRMRLWVTITLSDDIISNCLLLRTIPTAKCCLISIVLVATTPHIFYFSFAPFPVSHPDTTKITTISTKDTGQYLSRCCMCFVHAHNDPTRFAVVAGCKSLCYSIGNPWKTKCTWTMCDGCSECSGACSMRSTNSDTNVFRSIVSRFRAVLLLGHPLWLVCCSHCYYQTFGYDKQDRSMRAKRCMFFLFRCHHFFLLCFATHQSVVLYKYAQWHHVA